MTNFERLQNMSVEDFVEEIYLNVDDERNMMYIFGSWRKKEQLKEWLLKEVVK